MLQLQLRGDKLSSSVSAESQQDSKGGRYQLLNSASRLYKKCSKVNECPAGFKAGLSGDCAKAEQSEEGDVFGKLNHALWDSGWIGWTFRSEPALPV